jgi:hypothetical protein
LFVGSAFLLPIRPDFVLPFDRASEYCSFPEPGILVASSTLHLINHSIPVGRPMFVNLSTGEQWTIGLPIDQDRGQKRFSMSTTNVADIGIAWVSVVGCVGRHVVVISQLNPEGPQLQILDWRTGEEFFRRTIPNCDAGVLGGRLWICPRELRESKDHVVEMRSIPDGTLVETRLVAAQTSQPGSYSPYTGRCIVERLDAVLKVTDGATGECLFETESVSNSALALDCRHAAAISPWIRDGHLERRSWRIHEIPTGEVLAEREETRDPDAEQLSSIFALRNQNGVLVHRRYTLIPGAFPIQSDDLPDCEVWNWKTGDFKVRNAKKSFQHVVQSFNLLAESPLLIDGDRLVNVVTGETYPYSGSDVEGHSEDLGFAVVVSNDYQMIDRLLDSLGRFGRPLTILSGRGRARLIDLKTGRTLAAMRDNDQYFEFAPDSHSLISIARDSIAVWKLPIQRPWGCAAIWSLCVPFFVAGRAWLRRIRG